MNDFKQLLSTIEQVHQNLQSSAANAVNKALTLRNWLIGFYIVEFEQNGEDKAKYGGHLLSNIAKDIKIKGLTTPELSRCRQFYKVYPQILGTVSQEFQFLLPESIFGTLSQKKQKDHESLNILAIRGTASTELLDKLQVPSGKLIQRLSFSHFVELLKVDIPLKRTFYELECIRGASENLKDKSTASTLSAADFLSILKNWLNSYVKKTPRKLRKTLSKTFTLLNF